jgi:hypothetical protein
MIGTYEDYETEELIVHARNDLEGANMYPKRAPVFYRGPQPDGCLILHELEENYNSP